LPLATIDRHEVTTSPVNEVQILWSSTYDRYYIGKRLVG
jgi:hypothetical protein